MTDLSPAAQAVLAAFGEHPLHGDHIANDLIKGALPAALEAAADQVVLFIDELHTDHMRKRNQLLAIAAEPRGTNPIPHK